MLISRADTEKFSADQILIFNQSVDKKSAQKPYKAIFNSYELLLDFLYTFSLKISISKNTFYLWGKIYE